MKIFRYIQNKTNRFLQALKLTHSQEGGPQFKIKEGNNIYDYSITDLLRFILTNYTFAEIMYIIIPNVNVHVDFEF